MWLRNTTYEFEFSVKRSNRNRYFPRVPKTVGIVTGYRWTIRKSNPVMGVIFRTRPDRPWDHPTFFKMGNVSFPGVKLTIHNLLASRLRMGSVVTPLPPLGPWWPVIGWSLTLPLLHTVFVGLTYNKAIPLQALTGPEGSSRLRIQNFTTVGTGMC
jgi:hypothetical protein